MKSMRIKRLSRIICLVLCAVFAFALAGCGSPAEPRVEVETGTTRKYYDLYEPISQLENIDCDLYYEYHYARLNSATNENAKVTLGPYVKFGNQKVDMWRTYKLEERQNGAFCIDFSTSLNSSASLNSNSEWYDHTAIMNYNGLQNEKLISTHTTKIDRLENTKTDIDIAWDNKSTSPYYCTWVVDGMQTKHRVDYNGQLDRIWNIRLYVLFVDSETTVTLHEYIFHMQFHCYHDENGNEIYDGYSDLYDIDGVLIEENRYWTSMDKWLNDRYTSQSYSAIA